MRRTRGQREGRRNVEDEHWKHEPESQDLPAAGAYLSLPVGPGAAAELAKALRKRDALVHYASEDLLRASRLPLPSTDGSEVASDLRKVALGSNLPPVLLVEGDPLPVADGYHRICASYHLGEKADVPCRIVPHPVVDRWRPAGAPSTRAGEMTPSPEYPYPDDVRSEMLAFVPSGLSRVLDVGCGWGGFGQALKQRDPGVEVWGIETSAAACEVAGTRIDRVVHGTFPESLDASAPAFDCIVFNDVLEHLVEPGEALGRTRGLLDSRGVVVASIPNVRDLRVVFPLVVLGRWQYSDVGLLDRTHLRFFTRSSIIALFVEAGYAVEQIEAINLGLSKRFPVASRAAERALGRTVNAFRTPQYAIVARPLRRSP